MSIPPKKQNVGVLLNNASKRDVTGKAVAVFDLEDIQEPKDPNNRGKLFQKVATFNGANSMNILEVMSNLSKPEQRAMVEISKKLTWKGYDAELPMAGLTKYQKSDRYRVFKKLATKNLVRRIGPERYMINPNLVFPGKVQLEREAHHVWNLNNPVP